MIDVVPLERTSGPLSGRDVAQHDVCAVASKPQVTLTDKPQWQANNSLIMDIKLTTILSSYPLMTQADVV